MRFYKGGIYFGRRQNGNTYSPEEAFKKFISKLEDCRLLTDDTLCGITLVLKANFTGIDEMNVPYKIFVPNSNGEIQSIIVSKILLKMVFYREEEEEEEEERKITFNNMTKLKTSRSELQREVITQVDIYKKSFISNTHFLDPNCPAVLNYSINLEKIYKEQLLKILLGSFSGDGIETVEKCFDENISLISMVFLDNYETMYDFLIRKFDSVEPSDLTKKYYDLIIYELINLYRSGYIHGDIHLWNVMINEHANNSDTYSEKIMLIDFGRSRQHYIDNPQF
jgi:hypothetical protein